MEWLLAHCDDAEPLPTSSVSEVIDLDKPGSSSSAGPSSSSEGVPAASSSSAVAKSLKCDDCGKLFRSQTEVEFHAGKSGHANFSESSEEKKPLSEEEKKEQLARLEELLKQKRIERENKEKVKL